MASVAGDFYDFLKTGGNCLTILVADVSGHGVPAALVASMLKVCFGTQREQAHNPAGEVPGGAVVLGQRQVGGNGKSWFGDMKLRVI